MYWQGIDNGLLGGSDENKQANKAVLYCLKILQIAQKEQWGNTSPYVRYEVRVNERLHNNYMYNEKMYTLVQTTY